MQTHPDNIRLRPEVVVRTVEEETTIEFAHWRVSLPSEAVRGDAALSDLLKGRDIDVGAVSESCAGVISLLDAQGCFLPAVPDRLTAREILKLFQPLRSALYAQYYGHPVWARLRSGHAGRGELVAWMVHNYHVSRSAGVIAARMAVHAKDPAAKAFFQQDALEEYWHCDAFYFVEKVGVDMNASAVKDYVPLPASTAFEEHALRVAEEDPLGHLLIAYFQESSIMFRKDSERFYDAVESNYGLSDAFAGWRRHMTLDMDHDHAGELEARFDDETPISREAAARSIRAVHLAQFFLLRALDQIAAHAAVDDALALRQPASFLGARPATAEEAGTGMTRSSGAYLLQALRDAAFRALAFARDHDHIIAAGRLASRAASLLSDSDPVDEPASPWLVACRNFLIERGAEPDVLLDLAEWIAEVVKDGCPDLREAAGRLSPGAARAPGSVTQLAITRLGELLELSRLGEELPSLALVRT